MLSRWWFFARRTAQATLDDNGPGLAAQLAFYFLLALFPALLFLVALIGVLPVENVLGRLLTQLSQVAPPDVISILRAQLLSISEGEPLGVLTLGIVGALWSSSAALNAIIQTINAAYNLVERRPFWKVRALALMLTVLFATFIIVSISLVLVGPALADTVARALLLGDVFTWTWKIAQWPVVFALMCTGMGIVYFFAPAVPQRMSEVVPGAILGTVLWLSASLGFRVYVVRFSSYNETYGTIGGIITVMLWFYLSGLAIIVGAELNSEIWKARRADTDGGAGQRPVSFKDQS